MALTYSDVRAYVLAELTAAGYGTPDYPMPVFSPGPASSEGLSRVGAQAILYLMLGGGTGLQDEALFDGRLVTVRAVGPQNNYDGAEALAFAVDKILCTVTQGLMGSTPVLYCQRLGPSPQVVGYDEASRWSFQAGYIALAQSGY